MTQDRTARGTVVRWDDARPGALVEAEGLPEPCWAEAAVVHGASVLRAGQVVDLEWTEPAAPGEPPTVTRVVPREDLQATLGA
ncbi:hypothetical protein [Geodermatophilus marinus]|uniref:hypothetical protein n=1 Tax=Geodermatophilus sp. LHW52908 TaxID=2303986 RepID=UPI000E3B66CD|nr:hypothetical protein [Geodermatophilus sp. LHW52908]RFU22111.1 hypothetical protein D0Z06_08375 [Geodermatophilus sp. LHW52908]